MLFLPCFAFILKHQFMYNYDYMVLYAPILTSNINNANMHAQIKEQAISTSYQNGGHWPKSGTIGAHKSKFVNWITEQKLRKHPPKKKRQRFENGRYEIWKLSNSSKISWYFRVCLQNNEFLRPRLHDNGFISYRIRVLLSCETSMKSIGLLLSHVNSSPFRYEMKNGFL